MHKSRRFLRSLLALAFCLTALCSLSITAFAYRDGTFTLFPAPEEPLPAEQKHGSTRETTGQLRQDKWRGQHLHP